MNLAAPLQSYLLHWLSDMFTPACLYLDEEYRLIDWDGDVEAFGFPSLCAGQSLMDQVPVFEGLFPLEQSPFVLPRVKLKEETSVDLHCITENQKTFVLILDARHVEQKVHMVQQQLETRTQELAQVNEKLRQEIADHKKTEKALYESEERYRTLIRNLPVGLYRNTPGAQGKFIMANPAMARMFGYKTVEEFMKSTVVDLYQKASDHRAFSEKLLTKGQVIAEELQLKKKDGAPFWGAATARLVYDERTKSEYYDGLIEDITERKLAKEALKRAYDELETRVKERTRELQQSYKELEKEIIERTRAEEEVKRLNQDLERRVEKRTAELIAALKELDSFSYSVSHELRTPLWAIDGFSQMLKSNYADSLNENGRRCLEHISVNSKRMLQLIDSFLKLARMSRHAIKKETVNLSEIAFTIADGLKSAHPDRRVNFVISPNARTEGDSSLLYQVLENLLSNAWKFTKTRTQSRIEFGVMIEKNKPIYYVRDNGVGFDTAYMDKLFCAFQRLHSSETFEGTGIGLATVQRIIHKHEGSVWADSVLEHGSTFYFTLWE